MLRAALIGCGKIGSEFADDPLIQGVLSHAGAYAACETTELVAVCDANPDKAHRCGERWGVKARYTDVTALLAEQRPDIVSICTPDETHADMIVLALASPGIKAIFTEKPLAMTLAEAYWIEADAKERGVLLAINYSRRYSMGHMRLREQIQAGRLGAIQAVSGFYTKGTLHNGTHWYDLARFLVGNIVEVWARDALGESADDPTLDAYFRFDNGAAGFLHALNKEAFSLFEMDIVGTLGRARIVDSGHCFEISMAGESPYYSGYRTLLAAERESGHLEDVTLHAVEDLVSCLIDGGVPRCSVVDAIAALEVGFAMRKSALSGQVVTLPMR